MASPEERTTYAVPLDELLASARVDPATLQETREPLDTAGLPQEFSEDAVRIAQIAGG